MSKTPKPIVDPLNPRYKGVGGWLALLIISLTLFSPVALARDILENSDYWAHYFNRAPRLSLVIQITNIIGYCLIAFSVYAGISLWSVWPNAVRIAKTFLISAPLISIVLLFLPLTITLPESLYDKLLRQAWYEIPQHLLSPVAWFFYLTYSKRVAATYGLLTNRLRDNSNYGSGRFMKAHDSDEYEYCCSDCGGVIAPEAETCPHCGADTSEFVDKDNQPNRT